MYYFSESDHYLKKRDDYRNKRDDFRRGTSELKQSLFQLSATGVFHFCTEFLIWNRSSEKVSNFKVNNVRRIYVTLFVSLETLFCWTASNFTIHKTGSLLHPKIMKVAEQRAIIFAVGLIFKERRIRKMNCIKILNEFIETYWN